MLTISRCSVNKILERLWSDSISEEGFTGDRLYEESCGGYWNESESSDHDVTCSRVGRSEMFRTSFFFFFLYCFLYLSLCIDCKQSALFGEVRRTSQKISAKKRTQIDENLGPDDKYFPLSKNMKSLCNETTLISCSSGKTHPK